MAKTHYTQWAGTFAVAAELSRRRYGVSLTLGNTPACDLLAISPLAVPFKIEVKSAATKNYVPIGRHFMEKPVENDLFLIVVLASPKIELPFQFHILTHAELRETWSQAPQTKRDGQPIQEGWTGLDWRWFVPHKDRWDKLPA